MSPAALPTDPDALAVHIRLVMRGCGLEVRRWSIVEHPNPSLFWRAVYWTHCWLRERMPAIRMWVG